MQYRNLSQAVPVSLARESALEIPLSRRCIPQLAMRFSRSCSSRVWLCPHVCLATSDTQFANFLSSLRHVMAYRHSCWARPDVFPREREVYRCNWGTTCFRSFYRAHWEVSIAFTYECNQKPRYKICKFRVFVRHGGLRTWCHVFSRFLQSIWIFPH